MKAVEIAKMATELEFNFSPVSEVLKENGIQFKKSKFEDIENVKLGDILNYEGYEIVIIAPSLISGGFIYAIVK